MSTTTIRLPEELKTRIARAAKRAGTTAHNFILNAVEEKTTQEERRSEFHDVADQRHADTVANGKAVPWLEMRRFLEDRLSGKPAKRPAARKLAR